MTKTATIHQGHAVVLADLSDEINLACHDGEKRSYFVHLHDMKAGEAYAIPRPDLDAGQCAFIVAQHEGEMFYHEGQNVVAFVPATDIASDYGCWRSTPAGASATYH